MKKITKMLLSLSMLLLLSFTLNVNAQDCYSPTYPSGSNLVPNPSFDGDFASQTGWAKAWTNFDPKSTENSCGTDTTGSLFLKGNCWPDGGVLEFDSGIAIVPGHRYQIIAHIKNETAADNAFNFHLPSGIWDLAATNNHPTDDAFLVGIPNGTGWVLFDQTITAGANASGNVKLLFMSCDGFVASTIDDLIYLDNFEIYDLDQEAPALTVSKTKLLFNESNTQLTFEVTGNNLNEDITLIAPTGISLDIASISYATASTPTTVTATWDASANIMNQEINIFSGYDASANVNVIASIDSPCFTPLDANLNLISDPTVMDRSNFGGWGDVTIAVDAEGACGATSALLTITGEGTYSNGGCAFDINGITFAPNTQYGLQAKMKTVGGHIAFKLINGGADTFFDDNSNSPLIEVNTSDAWVTISNTFTTGADPTNLSITFNSADLVTNAFASEVHIDNLELYDMATLSVDSPNKNTLNVRVYPNPAKNVLNIDTSSNVSKLNIYDVFGRTVISKDSFGKSNLKSIDVSNLSSGTYILHATIDNQNQVIKFIK
ncbi:T9SS type A sorting domain-containing protein [Mariniflexile sp. HMF6888]|uniref:T9SS type A sorting domain-containing protein n=1 Tax=Mariniflexile sp. HMF6888 TaxID=3373086 RepID=UPI0037B38959